MWHRSKRQTDVVSYQKQTAIIFLTNTDPWGTPKSNYSHKLHYNPGHNILALLNNLAQVSITTSKTLLDI